MTHDKIDPEWDLRLEGILFYGDPHGRWEPLLDAIDASVHTVIILGDLAEPKRHPEHVDTARLVLAEVTKRGIDCYMVSGNHDSDTPDVCDLVYYELRDHLADGEIFRVGASSVAVAGLGGVVRGRIWDGVNAPSFLSPEELIGKTPRNARFREGLAVKQHSTIFPATVEHLGAQRADVLISHEAPSCHEHGFSFIDDLAESLGARLIVHGHHHKAYVDHLPNGVQVKGMGLAEVWRPRLALSKTQRDLLRAGIDSLEKNSGAYKLLKDR